VLKRLLLLQEGNTRLLGAAEGRRRITSAAVLIGVALRNFSLKENHYASAAAWTLFAASKATSQPRQFAATIAVRVGD
jgi:hypothetical protein